MSAPPADAADLSPQPPSPKRGGGNQTTRTPTHASPPPRLSARPPPRRPRRNPPTRTGAATTGSPSAGKHACVICHRGASELAHENTLEAYRATFELGGDGNEFDIRTTKDGVLVVFHDDMLDRLLDAYGDVSEFTWAELQQFRFRDPGRFGDQCRIPTVEEVFDLHRRHAGLMHLDIKRPGLDGAIAGTAHEDGHVGPRRRTATPKPAA